MNEINIAWQQRTELLLGKDKMKRLRHAHVLVVGLGGVGWLAVAGAVVTIGTLVSWGYEVYEGWKDYTR